MDRENHRMLPVLLTSRLNMSASGSEIQDAERVLFRWSPVVVRTDSSFLTKRTMAEQEAQYDHIGSKYDEYARTATLKRAESYTFFRMVGALAGKSVLDLACGFGFYTRLLKRHGAAQVLGVDISPEMIRLARQ